MRDLLRGLTAFRPRLRTQAGLGRLLAFSDGVLAIAITLVALPLVDIGESGPLSVSEYFSSHSYAVLAAVISFASIAGFWRDHHLLFERATGYSWLLVRLNFVWLASIVFLPIATVILVRSRGTHEPQALALYFVVLLVSKALLNLEELELLRTGSTSDDPPPGPIELIGRWIPIALRVVALSIALTFPRIGIWAVLILLLGPLQLITIEISRRRATRRD